MKRSDYDKNKVGIRYRIKKIIPETKMIYKVKYVINNNIYFESKPAFKIFWITLRDIEVGLLFL